MEAWAFCTARQVDVTHYPGHSGQGGGSSSPEYWEASGYYQGAVAVSTNRRILVRSTDSEEDVASWARGTTLAVDYQGGLGLSCVDRDGEILDLRFKGETEAASFAGLIREHQSATSGSVDKVSRISC